MQKTVSIIICDHWSEDRSQLARYESQPARMRPAEARGQKADGGQSLVSAQTQSGSAGEHRLVFWI